jgi:hypothetical protein
MIDPAKEKMIRLEDVRDFIPSSRKGKKLSKAVPFRWAARGVGGVVLETTGRGRGRRTSVEALQRFIVETNRQNPPQDEMVGEP